jgi:hypothetical protein
MFVFVCVLIEKNFEGLGSSWLDYFKRPQVARLFTPLTSMRQHL